MSKLNIVFCSSPDYAGAAKPLYQYMKKHYKDFVYHWVFIEMQDIIIKDNNTKVYKYGSKSYYQMMEKADIIFSTHFNLTKDKNQKAIYIDLWHGIGVKTCGYFTKNLNEFEEKWLKDNVDYVDYLIVPNEFWSTIFSALFSFDGRRILPLGYPKFDSIINKNAKKDLEKVLEIKVDKYSKIIYYMPTFKNGCGRVEEIEENKEDFLYIEDYNEKELYNYLKKNNYLLVKKEHPGELIKCDKIDNDYMKLITEDMLQNKNIALTKILDAADLLISDYSSLLIEFQFLKKPVVFIENEIELMASNRGIIFGDYYYWSKGNSARNLNELLAKLDSNLNNYEYNKELYNLYFGDLKNGGCSKICNYIFKNGKINPMITRKIETVSILKQFLDNKNAELNNINDQLTNEKQLNLSNRNIIDSQNDIMNKQNHEISNLKNRVDILEKENYSLDTENKMMKNSKVWRISEKIRKIISFK